MKYNFEKYQYWVIFLKDFLNTFSQHPHETSRDLKCDIHSDCPKIWSNYTVMHRRRLLELSVFSLAFFNFH